MKRRRFQTIRPIYSSLLRMPFPRRSWPWIVLAAQFLPRGPGTFSRLGARFPKLTRSRALRPTPLCEVRSAQWNYLAAASTLLLS